MVVSFEQDTATLVQILEVVVSISFSKYTLGKGWNQQFSHRKIVGQSRFFDLGTEIGLGEVKLRIKPD